MSFIDQMLDWLVERGWYSFLDGYSGYNQISIALEDQEKITFTWPYGTFAFKRMPFGLGNAPATFQWLESEQAVRDEFEINDAFPNEEILAALKWLNQKWNEAVDMRLGQLKEMDEFRLEAYERADFYRETMKKYYDRRIEKRDFYKGELVLLFNSRLKFFPGMTVQENRRKSLGRPTDYPMDHRKLDGTSWEPSQKIPKTKILEK
ncbi:uncharacterized protein LOC124898517 [Capsicum annuum]|uniref:uncharacterized protein LOC124898517 n=1 Tax=Capsicum annuum TaxID=4072 RepID=UPI001FB16717|nr:uncharacterized protein LOC124898517 [Capsicum annuum]